MFPVEFSYSEIERKNLNHLYPVKTQGSQVGSRMGLVTLVRTVSLFSHWPFLNNVT